MRLLLLSVLAVPSVLWAQGGTVKVDVGAVNPSGGVGVVGSGAVGSGVAGTMTGAQNTPLLTSPSLPSAGVVPIVQPGARPNAAAAMQPAAASFAAPTAVVPSASPKASFAAPSAASPQILPGSVHSASPEMAPRPGSGGQQTPVFRPETPGAGSGGAGSAVTEIQKARERERKGAQGQIDGALNTLFDASKARSAASPSAAQRAAEPGRAAAAEMLPDPKTLGPAKALEKVRALAAGASAADAPRLYEHAVSIAQDMPSGAKSAADIRAQARGRAPKAVPQLAGDALRSAVENRRAETERYTKALAGWNGLLSTPGESYIANLDEFQAAVEAVRSQAEAARGRKLPAPKAVAEALPGKEHPRMRLKVRLDAELSGGVPVVPGSLALSLALPELSGFVPWELPAQAELRDAFGLAARGSPAAFYRASRAEGRSVLASFWLSARRWLGARTEALLQRLQMALMRLLQRLGLVPSAAEPAFEVDASESVRARLRALSPAPLTAERTRALPSDPYRLGYRLTPTAP